MQDFEKDVPLQELRHRYLRKYPLEVAGDNSSATPGYSSYFNLKKRTPVRLACDIVLFVTFMFFILMVTVSFASSYTTASFGSGKSYGVLAFFFHTVSSVENAMDSLNYSSSAVIPELFISGVISEVILCITALEIAITTLVCFIIAIVHFSKRNSLKLVNIITYYFSAMISAYMTFALFGASSIGSYANIFSGYKISGATSFAMVLMTIVMIGCSVGMFISKRKVETVSKKLWIANITFATIGALCLSILSSAKLGSIVYTIFDFLYNANGINFDGEEFIMIIMLIICALFSVCFSILNGALKNSFRHLVALDENEAQPKVKEFSPMKDTIIMTSTIFVALVLTALIFGAPYYSHHPFDIIIQSLFVFFFSAILIVVSAIFRERKPKVYSSNTPENEIILNTSKPKPVSTTSAQPKPVAKPVPKPVAKESAPVQPVPKAQPMPVAKPSAQAQPMPKPIPKPVPKPVATETTAATQKPVQKVVIKMPKKQ